MDERTPTEKLIDLVFAQQMATVCLFEAFAQHSPDLVQSGLAALRRAAESENEHPGIQAELTRLTQNIEAKLPQTPLSTRPH